MMRFDSSEINFRYNRFCGLGQEVSKKPALIKRLAARCFFNAGLENVIDILDVYAMFVLIDYDVNN